MSAPQNESSVQDDNILNRRQNIKDSLNVIKDKKERLRTAMRIISQQETPDRDMMSDLLTAFDQMSTQEEQYLQLLKSIVDIHEQATKEVTEEVEKLREEEKNKPKEEKKETKEESSEVEKVSSDEMTEIQETLKEIEKVAQQAVQASILNEKLVESLQLHRNKRATMNEIRKEKTANLLDQADQLFAEVKLTKNRVMAEKSEREAKKKELAELQKKTLEKGIELGVLEGNQREEVMSALEKIGEKFQELSSRSANVDETEDKIERINEESERIASLNATIQEKLNAMDARKQRMIQIREMIVAGKMADEESEPLVPTSAAPDASLVEGSTEEDDKTELESTIRDARHNLQSLTALKERLEGMQRNGEELTEEDAALIEKLDC